MKIRRVLLSTIASSAALCGVQPSVAQDAVKAPEADQGADIVVVTAQRFSESLERVPLAVTKLDADDLNRSDIKNLDSLQFYVPGLVSGFGTSFTTLRGVGTSQPGSAVEAGVATNIDGIYVGRASATQSYFDLDSIEVLRGPQGTLYGRNATGGAINIISARPTDEFHAGLTAIAGNFDRQRAEGFVSGPIFDGLSGRLAVMSDRRESFVDNIVPGGPEIRGEDAEGARASVRLVPTPDGPTFDLIVDYTHIDSSGNVPSYISWVMPASAPTPQLFTTDPTKVAQTIDNRTEREMWGANLTASFNVGDLTLRTITGYRESQRDALSSGQPTSDNRSYTVTDEHADQFSQEVQLLSDYDSKLRWVAGLYYFTESVDATYETKAFLDDLPVLLLFGIPNFTLFPVRYEETLPQNFRSESWAAYAQGTYSISDTLRATVGIRYTRDSKVGTGGAVDARVVDLSGALGVLLSGPALGGPASVDADWEAVTPKVGVEWDVSPNTLLYASATRGYKPGNSNLTYLSEPVRPEFVWAYEAGLKTRLFDDRVRLSVGAYHYDYTDMQVFGVVARPGGGFAAGFLNAAEATIDGVDLEVIATPIDGLDINASYGYLDATYGSFLNGDEFLDPNVLAPAAATQLEGNTLQRAPRDTLNIGAQYTVNMGELDLVPRVEYSYRSKVYASEFEHEQTAQDSYSLWNARLSLISLQGWRLAAFGNNLSNEHYFGVVNESQAGRASGVYASPRTYGLEFGINF